MSADRKPLLQVDDPVEEDSRARCCRYSRYCGLAVLLVLAIVFVICWIIQGCIYAFATHGCNSDALQGYHYPSGDGPGDDEIGGNSTNVLPRNQMLQYHDGWPSDSFDITRASRFGHGGMGKVGTWYRYGGPIFTTYVFMDVPSGVPTVYMRHNLLRMGMSHRMERCDGKGPFVEVYEGSNYLWNRMRRNSLFQWLVGRGTDYTFKISIDGTHTVDSLQADDGITSISFASLDHSHIFASGAQDQESSQWMIQNDFEYASTGETQPIPYWATSATTILFAFNKHHNDDEAADHSEFLEKPVVPDFADLAKPQDSGEAPDGTAEPAPVGDADAPGAAATSSDDDDDLYTQYDDSFFTATESAAVKAPDAGGEAAAVVEKEPLPNAAAAAVEKQPVPAEAAAAVEMEPLPAEAAAPAEQQAAQEKSASVTAAEEQVAHFT